MLSMILGDPMSLTHPGSSDLDLTEQLIKLTQCEQALCCLQDHLLPDQKHTAETGSIT